MYELVFMAQEDILCHSQAWQGTKLLHDNGDTLVICLNLVFRMDLFSIQYKGTASDAVDTGQHVGQGWFTGTVLTDQRMYLAFVYVKWNILNRLRDTEGLAKIFYL